MRIGEINNTLKPSVPYLEYYGANLTIVLGFPDWNNIMWSVEQVCTSDFTYESDGSTGGIRIQTTGIYRLDLELGFDCTPAGGNVLVMTRILNNGSELIGSRSCGLSYYLQLNSSKTVYLKKGDIITTEFQTTDDTIFIMDINEPDEIYSRFRITFIPFGGFNNGFGGNIINRGIRR